MTEAVLGKEYASLKGYHSGELVNWVVSDVTVIKNGVMSLLPTLLRTAMRFIGTAAILISWDCWFIPVLIPAGFHCSGLIPKIMPRKG